MRDQTEQEAEADRKLWNNMWTGFLDVKKPKGDNEMVEFKPVSKKESNIIERIVGRAYLQSLTSNPADFEMDLVAIHQNDCLLNFEELLQADDFNFAHDICGIQNHINRNTGKLMRGFLPRCTFAAVRLRRMR